MVYYLTPSAVLYLTLMPRRGFSLSSRSARMASKALREVSEGSSMGPWERAV